MKDLFFRFCRWALPFFGVSAVVSCDNVFNTPDMYGTQVAEYGVPVMEYVVKGKVTDATTGNPIKGIQVTSDDGYEPILTTETGDFECIGDGMPDEKVMLTFTDIDGEVIIDRQLGVRNAVKPGKYGVETVGNVRESRGVLVVAKGHKGEV